jgi:hypothetical protein
MSKEQSIETSREGIAPNKGKVAGYAYPHLCLVVTIEFLIIIGRACVAQ